MPKCRVAGKNLCKPVPMVVWPRMLLFALASGKPYTIHPSGAVIVQEEGFEVVFLSPTSNRLMALEETASHAVSLSGGMGSAFAGNRVIRLNGRENVMLWFADVLKEDPDLYRFVWDLMRRWGGRLYYFCDGRRPEQVWEQRKIIPNNRMCPCSYELKVKPFREFITAMPQLPHVYIGYKWDETDRQERTCASYDQAIPECVVEYPLLWEPKETRDLAEVCWEEFGIIPPRLYAMGFSYNNCAGDCCRSGIGGRVLEAICVHEQFQQAMEWEEAMRAMGGAREGKAFCSRQVGGKKVPLPLRTILCEYVPLAREYLEEHPQQRISEKTLIREIKKWQHRKNLPKKEAQKERTSSKKELETK